MRYYLRKYFLSDFAKRDKIIIILNYYKIDETLANMMWIDERQM